MIRSLPAPFARALRLAAAPLLTALPAAAQEAGPLPVPACAEGGIQRLATTVPPGTTPEELAGTLQQSGLAPGTQVKLLADHERPRLVNVERMDDLFGMHILRLLRTGLEVHGEAFVLLSIDAEGRVTGVRARTGDRELDRQLRLLWRRARFEPVVVGECRVPAYLHERLDFRSDYTREGWREMEVRRPG